jgi:uncharacterized protein YciU (UPF0263 family)
MHSWLILAAAALVDCAYDIFLALDGKFLDLPDQFIFRADGKLRIIIRYACNFLFKFTFDDVPISLEF